MSSKYRVDTTSRRVEREIEKLPRSDRGHVIAAINSLADAPRPYGAKQLGPSVYRLRAGSYRVIYRVLDDERIVLIGRVARRSERTYRKWQQLFEEPAPYAAAVSGPPHAVKGSPPPSSRQQRE